MRWQIWSRKFKRYSWMTLLSGLTSRHLTMQAGAEWWTSHMAALHASRIRTPASGAEVPMNGSCSTSGSTDLGSCNLESSSSRMLKASSPAGCQTELFACNTFSRDWRTSDIAWKTTLDNRRLEYSARLKSALRTGANESSSSPSDETWQTPATDSFRSRGGERKSEMGLDQMARLWPTVKTATGDYSYAPGSKTKVQNLEGAAKSWPSPRSEDSESCGNHPGATDSLTGAMKQWRTATADLNRGGAQATEKRLQGGHTMNLADQVTTWGNGSMNGDQAAQWTTPQARDVTMRGIGQVSTAKAGNACLARDAANWPSPIASDHKSGQVSLETTNRNSRPLREVSCQSFLQDLPTEPPGGESSAIIPSSRLRLNPMFVEWLLGLPSGWTACGCSATESCQLPQPKPLQRCLSGLAEDAWGALDTAP